MAAWWDEVVIRDALASRHMGRMVRAWRTHPHHGRHPIPQERVAGWMGITQAQLSRIENGPPLPYLTDWCSGRGYCASRPDGCGLPYRGRQTRGVRMPTA